MRPKSCFAKAHMPITVKLSRLQNMGYGCPEPCISATFRHAVAKSRAAFENRQCNNTFTAYAVESGSEGSYIIATVVHRAAPDLKQSPNVHCR